MTLILITIFRVISIYSDPLHFSWITLLCFCWSVYWDETCPNQPHLLHKYQNNIDFSYFQGIGILSVMNILASYKINKYHHLFYSSNLFIWYAIIFVWEDSYVIFWYERDSWAYHGRPRTSMWSVHYTGRGRPCGAFITPVVFAQTCLPTFTTDNFGWVTVDMIFFLPI